MYNMYNITMYNLYFLKFDFMFIYYLFSCYYAIKEACRTYNMQHLKLWSKTWTVQAVETFF